MTNTTPLNEEDRLGEILTAVFNEGMAYQVSSLKDYKDLNFMSVKTAKQELTNLIQTLEKKARIDELNIFTPLAESWVAKHYSYLGVNYVNDRLNQLRSKE